MNTVCEAVADLIPLCRDKSASAGSVQFVKAHLELCPACRKYYKDYVKLMKAPRAADNFTVTVGGSEDFAALAKRIRKRRNTLYLGTIFFLGGVAFASVKMAQAMHKANAKKEM